jgi:hypothetical protein
MKKKVQKLENSINKLVKDFMKKNEGFYISKYEDRYIHNAGEKQKFDKLEIKVEFDLRYCNE